MNKEAPDPIFAHFGVREREVSRFWTLRGCVRGQVSNFASNRNAVLLVSFPQRALDLQYHPQGHLDRGGDTLRDRNPPKSPEGAPEPAGPRTRTTARHRHVTKTEPTSTRAAHPVQNLPETAPDERGTSSSVKALVNAVADIPTLPLHCAVGDQHNTTGTTRELKTPIIKIYEATSPNGRW